MKTHPPKSHQIQFRASESIVQRVDALSEALAEADGGIPPGRSTVIRRLVSAALPMLEQQLNIHAERRAS
jgi:hypothetical protein